MLQNSISILAVLFFVIGLSEWLSTKAFFKHLGTGLMVIIFTAIISNFGLIPASTTPTPVYEGVFKYIAPLSIFFMLLNINLKSLKLAGKPMLFMFFVGALATCIGAVIAMYLLNMKSSIGEFYYAIGGMFTGSYIGGSINFNAVAITYDVSKQAANLFSAATVADNIISAVWVGVTLALPNFMQKKFPRNIISKIETDTMKNEINDSETINPFDISIVLLLGFAAIGISEQLTRYIPSIPSVLWLTTIAITLAQFKGINKLTGHKTLGLLGVYLFLAVIGAYCDIAALLKDGDLAITLMLFVSLLVFIHGLLIFGIGGLLKQDWNIVAIASQANVGGTATALALARSLKRTDLLLPGILVGALGNALGTYFGIFIAEFFRQSSMF